MLDVHWQTWAFGFGDNSIGKPSGIIWTCLYPTHDGFPFYNAEGIPDTLQVHEDPQDDFWAREVALNTLLFRKRAIVHTCCPFTTHLSPLIPPLVPLAARNSRSGQQNLREY